MLRLKLRSFLKRHHISETALADAIATVIDVQPVSERYLRYLASNTELLTPENKDKKPSLVMLGFIIRGLRYLTGEAVGVTDVVEYTGEPYEDELLTLSPRENTQNASESKEAPPETALVPLKPSDSHSLLDQIKDLTIERLNLNNRPDLGLAFAVAVGGEAYTRATYKPRRFTKSWVTVLTLLLTTSVAIFAYDRLIVQPKLLAARGGVFAFRDRIKATSDLDIPTLIGPEGEVNQLEPVLRVSDIPAALAYEFYVENTVSGDGVYTGPLPNSSFPIPTGTLCPNTPYEWRVRALGGDGWTSFSSALEFTVLPETLSESQQDLLNLARIEEPPDVPVIAAPLGSTSSTTPTLEVEAAPNVMGYGFYIRDLQTDSVIYNNNFALTNAVQVPDELLEEGGIYQWNTRARNCHYWSEFTPAQVFNVDVQERN